MASNKSDFNQAHLKSSWWLNQPHLKNNSQNWIISPNSGKEHETYLKPPTRNVGYFFRKLSKKWPKIFVPIW